MPRIDIKELDATTAASLTSVDAVFVPGFVNLDEQGEQPVAAFIPTLCTNIDEFEAYFGKYPAKFVKNYAYDARFPRKAGTGNMFLKDDPDPSYVYAKELIYAGLPVIYERVNETANDVDADVMYDFLAKQTTWDELTDKNWYSELKYVTSGGYPTFECSDTTVTIDPKPSDDKFVVSFDEDEFITKVGGRGEQEDTYLLQYAKEVQVFTGIPAAALFAHNTDLRIADSTTGIVYKLVIEGEGEELTETVVEAGDDWQYWSIKKNAGEYSTITADILTFGLLINPLKLDIHDTIKIVVPATDAVNSAVANYMLALAAKRGDCVALIDHTNKSDRPLKGELSVYNSVSDTTTAGFTAYAEFGAMFTPWCVCDFYTSIVKESTDKKPAAMPASFVYLKALAKSMQTNASWLAIAGAARGVAQIKTPYLAGGIRLTNAIAESYQTDEDTRTKGVSINPITYINPYGYLIWGNRTLKFADNGLTATSFLNIRNLISDVKKIAYAAAKKCLFEQNSDILWINYKAMITPTLEQMVSGSGISSYKIIKVATNEKAKLKCIIRLYPIYAVEVFDITVELADDDSVTVQ